MNRCIRHPEYDGTDGDCVHCRRERDGMLGTLPIASNGQARRWVMGVLPVMLGSQEAADKWLNAHNIHLNGVPAELIKTTDGVREVVNYLRVFRGYQMGVS